MKTKPLARHRHLLAPLLLLALFFLLAQPALAHANLVRSEPAANSAQPVSPTVVRLWFSEDIEPSFTSARVLTSAGAQVDKGDSHRAPNDSREMDISVADLPRGLYTVAWNAISAVDGHATSGSFAFTVGDVPLSESSPREIIALVDTEQSNREPPPAYQVVTRGFNLLALLLLAGALAFPLFILFPALQSAQAQKPPLAARALDDARARWTPRWLRLLGLGLLLYALATLAMLAMQALISGGLQTVPRVLTATRFGTFWWLRVLALAALAVLVYRARARWLADFHLDRALLAAGALGLCLVLVQSLNSHDAAADPPALGVLIDFIHMLGAAIWLGGLLQLALTLPAFIKGLEGTQQQRMLRIVVTRFSFVALLVVGIIGASGVYSTVAQAGSLEALFATLYGNTLLVKLVLVGLVLAIAAFNLIVVKPGLAQSTLQRSLGIARMFRRATWLEIAVGVAILVAVGVLTSAQPARSAYDPSPKLLLQTQRVDDLQVTLGIAPDVVGTNDFDVKVQEAADGTPVSNAQVVRILGTMLEMDMGTQEIALTPQGNGHYTLRGDLLSMVGRWGAEVLIRREGYYDARTTFAISALGQPPAPEPSYASLALQQPEVLLGLGLALAAFAIGAASVVATGLQTRERRVTLVGAIGVALLGLIVVWQNPVVVGPPSGVTAASLFVPEPLRFIPNPVPPTPENLAAGRQTYQTTCAVCHGPQGKGNGPLAINLNPRPVDLTVHARLHTEGELYYWVTNGIKGSAMPAWGEQFNDTQRWQVVDFIRTLGLPSTPAP